VQLILYNKYFLILPQQQNSFHITWTSERRDVW
jgi:hypothetical protein